VGGWLAAAEMRSRGVLVGGKAKAAAVSLLAPVRGSVFSFCYRSIFFMLINKSICTVYHRG
jgi:hypothetical protein